MPEDKSTPYIIVVDDSLSVRQFFERCAAALHVDLRCFESAPRALPSLLARKPDLLFLDIIAPEQDGLTFLQELRKLNNHHDTKVIMLSSKDYLQDRNTAFEFGALDFVAKPMNTKTIRNLIIQHTGARPRDDVTYQTSPGL